MAKLPALPIFTDAYLADTRHLTTLQHGAYFLLMMTAWRSSGCDLPDDDKLLARWSGLDIRTWKNNKNAVMGLWRLVSGRWTQGRLKDQHENSCSLVAQRAAAGRSSALKRNNRDAAVVENSSSERSTILNLTSKKEPSTSVEGKKEAPPAEKVEDSPETKKQKLEAIRMQLTKFEDYAKTHGIKVEIVAHEMEKFTQYCLSGKGKYTNYEAAFRNWLLRLKEDHPHGNTSRPSAPQPRADKSVANKDALIESARQQGLIP